MKNTFGGKCIGYLERIQLSKTKVLVTVLEATKLDFPRFGDCGHQTCFHLQLGFWSYEGRCHNSDLSCPCSMHGAGNQCLRSTSCMPTCSHQGHLSPGILGTVAQWHSSLDLQSSREAGKAFYFLVELRGKGTPLNTTNA